MTRKIEQRGTDMSFYRGFRIRHIRGRWFVTDGQSIYSVNPSWTAAARHVDQLCDCDYGATT